MNENLPMVSVIMPIRNESKYITSSLGAVLSQDYPSERMEILIVDGESDDDTITKIEALAQDDGRVLIFMNPERNQAAGLNLAIPMAKGEVIVRVDGHTIITPDYVRNCVKVLQKTHADCVGGKQNALGITPMGRAIATANASWFSVPSQFKVGNYEGPTDTVYLGAWPRQVFERVGLYNPRLVPNEDYELCHRIRKAGGLVYLSPQIQAAYYGRQDLIALWRQYFRYGQGKVETLSIAPESLKLRHLAAPFFVLSLIGGGFLGIFSRKIAVLWGFMLTAYSTAMSIATAQILQEKITDSYERRSQSWRIPLTFMTVHIAWGSGFLWRIVKKLVK